MRFSSAAQVSGRCSASTPKPSSRPAEAAHIASRSSFSCAAKAGASPGSTKSIHGLAELTTDTAMPCLSMKASLRLTSWNSPPIGRPAEVEVSASSSGRMIKRSPPARDTMRGTWRRARNRAT